METTLVVGAGTVVWTPQTPKPRYWTATSIEQPVLYLLWSYKTWTKKIVIALFHKATHTGQFAELA